MFRFILEDVLNIVNLANQKKEAGLGQTGCLPAALSLRQGINNKAPAHGAGHLQKTIHTWLVDGWWGTKHIGDIWRISEIPIMSWSYHVLP